MGRDFPGGPVLRIHLSVQWTRVRPLLPEHFTCREDCRPQLVSMRSGVHTPLTSEHALWRPHSATSEHALWSPRAATSEHALWSPRAATSEHALWSPRAATSEHALWSPCSATREASSARSLHAATERSPCSLQPERSREQQQRPNRAKNNK